MDTQFEFYYKKDISLYIDKYLLSKNAQEFNLMYNSAISICHVLLKRLEKQN